MKNDDKIEEKVYRDTMLLCWSDIILCSVLKMFNVDIFQIASYSTDFEKTKWAVIAIYAIFYIINWMLFYITLLKKIPTFAQCLTIISAGSLLFFSYNFLSYYDIGYLSTILETIVFVSISFTFTRKIKGMIEAVFISLLFFTYQALSLLTKNMAIVHGHQSFISSLVFQIDYYMLMLITALFAIKKGGYLYELVYKSFRRRLEAIHLLLAKRKGEKRRLQEDPKNVRSQVGNKRQEIGYIAYLLALSLFQITVVGTICYFVHDTIINFALIFISFVLMRATLGKSYHSDTILKCTAISSAIFLCATRSSLPMGYSILSSTFIGCFVAYLLHVYAIYLENKNKKKELKFMTLDELRQNISQFSDTEIRLLYSYWHKDNSKTVDDICDEFGYNKMKIYRLLKKVKEVSNSNGCS